MMDAEKVVVIMPTRGNAVPAAKQSILREVGDYGYPFVEANGEPRDVNRNRNIQNAMDKGFEYIVMVDDDQIVPPGGVQKLVELEKDIVIAPTPIMINDRVFMNIAQKQDGPEGRYVWSPVYQWDESAPPHICEIGGTGMFAAKRSVYERLEWPWFVEEHGDRYGNGARTEDVPFFERCKTTGIEVWCHPAVVCGHMKRVNLLDICTAKDLELGFFVKQKQIKE